MLTKCHTKINYDPLVALIMDSSSSYFSAGIANKSFNSPAILGNSPPSSVMTYRIATIASTYSGEHHAVV